MPAFAQAPQSGPQAAAADKDRNADVIVVTANKREESVQDIAVAVTAISSQKKEEMGIISVTDLTNVTPGLSYTPGNERVTLRGIGRLSNSFGADPGVANYNDGVYTAFAVFAGKDPMLLNRVEVLRGPQGTLYGRNAIGGAINTISKHPTDKFEADAVLGLGDFDYRKEGVAVSGPITDWLRYRAVGFQEYRDGIDPDYGQQGEKVGWEINDQYLEFQLEGNIGDRFKWWFKTADLNYDKAGPPGGRTATFTSQPYYLGASPTATDTFNAGGYNPAFPYTGNPAIIGFTQSGTRHDNPFATNGEHAYNTSLQNTAHLPNYDEYIFDSTYSTDWFDIRYIAGYTYYKYKLDSDVDGTPIDTVTYNAANPALGVLAPVPIGTAGSGPITIHPNVTNIYRESRAAFSNEINFISTWDLPVQWIFGLYQYQDNQDQPGQAQYYFDEPLADRVFRGTGFVANAERRTQWFSNTSIQYAYGVYGQADWQINKQWKLTGGLRYSIDLKKSMEEAYLVLPYTTPGAPFFDATAAVYGPLAEGFESDGTAFRHLRKKDDAMTGTLGIEYRPMSDTLLFGKYSRGYKAGGFNNLGFAAAPYTNPEFVDAFEGGWKQTFKELHLTTDTALFYYNYKDQQSPLTVIRDFGLPTQTAFTAFVNVPKVRTYGIELEANWNPVENLNFDITYAYLNTAVQSTELYVDNYKDPRCISTAPATLGQKVTCNTTTATQLVDPARIRSVKGNQLGQSPKHKAAIQASYKLDMEDGSYFLPTLSLSWRDIFYDSFFNDAIEKSPSYFNLDGRLNWYSASGVWGLTFWARNLLNDNQETSVSGTFSARTFQLYENPSFSLPRTYGVDLKFHFK